MKLDDLRAGIIVRSMDPLEPTTGMMVKADLIAARTPLAMGKVMGPVPGHGGDVWWVRHADQSVAPYSFSELELVGIPKKLLEPPPEPTNIKVFDGLPRVDRLILQANQRIEPGTKVRFDPRGFVSPEGPNGAPFIGVVEGLGSNSLIRVGLTRPLIHFEIYKKDTLEVWCKEFGVFTNGLKDDMVNRLRELDIKREAAKAG